MMQPAAKVPKTLLRNAKSVLKRALQTCKQSQSLKKQLGASADKVIAKSEELNTVGLMIGRSKNWRWPQPQLEIVRSLTCAIARV